MRIVISAFMSLDGVVQAPGGPEEDTEGGFQHGGWSMPYFDPEAMPPMLDEAMARTEASVTAAPAMATARELAAA